MLHVWMIGKITFRTLSASYLYIPVLTYTYCNVFSYNWCTVTVGSQWFFLGSWGSSPCAGHIFDLLTRRWTAVQFDGICNALVPNMNPRARRWSSRIEMFQLADRDTLLGVTEDLTVLRFSNLKLRRNLIWERRVFCIWLRWLATTGEWLSSPETPDGLIHTGNLWFKFFSQLCDDIFRIILTMV